MSFEPTSYPPLQVQVRIPVGLGFETGFERRNLALMSVISVMSVMIDSTIKAREALTRIDPANPK